MSKLVAVFSYGGATKMAAQLIAGEEGAALFEIRAKIPYTDADVNWRDEKSRNVKEQKDDSCRPEIETLPDVEGVDEIWVGYPIWWYSHPRIINTFFDSVELEGVKIHLFATSGGSGIQNSFRELKITYPGLSFIDAKMM